MFSTIKKLELLKYTRKLNSSLDALFGYILKPHKILYSEYLTLIEIQRNEGIKVAELAKERSVSHQAVVQVTDKLDEIGLINKKMGDYDKVRSEGLYMTQKGLEAIVQASRSIENFMASNPDIEQLLVERIQPNIVDIAPDIDRLYYKIIRAIKK